MTNQDKSKKQDEILGLNRRNQEYVRPYNPASAKALADDKIRTKKVLTKNGINTPEVYKIIRSKQQLNHLDWDSLPKSFVIKPNKGTGGNGILVFYGKKKGLYEWIRPNGKYMTQKDIILHLENILEGRYSMGDRKDVAIIEERIQNDPLLKKYSYKGVPDIRIIVFNRVPVMAMLRLPTKRSDGKANLHAGAICTGIDVGTGITTYSMMGNYKSPLSDTYDLIETTLDLKENLPLSGVQIPNWDEILEIAVKCQESSRLGYVGVDIALDAEKGPMVFELNARPGLGIQVANQAGLRWRLERVRGLKVKSLKHGIRLAKELFGGEVEESIEAISGRQVVSIIEKIRVYHKDWTPEKRKKKKQFEVENAFMDTGFKTSRIDRGLSNRLGYDKSNTFFDSKDVPSSFDTFSDAQTYIDANEKDFVEDENIVRLAKIFEDGKIRVRPVFNVNIKISKEIKNIEMLVSTRTEMTYPIVIGREDLKGYLIDTTKTF
jgi:alpha-L-glutamate ligase-like protein